MTGLKLYFKVTLSNNYYTVIRLVYYDLVEHNEQKTEPNRKLPRKPNVHH